MDQSRQVSAKSELNQGCIRDNIQDSAYMHMSLVVVFCASTN